MALHGDPMEMDARGSTTLKQPGFLDATRDELAAHNGRLEAVVSALKGNLDRLLGIQPPPETEPMAELPSEVLTDQVKSQVHWLKKLVTELEYEAARLSEL